MQGQGDAIAPWQSDGGRQRGLRRWTVSMRAVLRRGRHRRACVASDLSPGGAAVKVFRAFDVSIGDAVGLVLAGYGTVPAEVRHTDGRRLGLMFTHDDTQALALARFLIAQAPPRKQPRERLETAARLLVRGRSEPCLLVDISRFDAGVKCDRGLTLQRDEEVLLRIDGVGGLQAIVSRIGAGELGLVLVDEYTGGARRPSAGAAG
jgi:PilZ domain